MRRREFITVLGSAAVAWPLAARAQQAAGKIPRIGIIDNAPLWDNFRQGLRDQGLVEGRTVALEYRTAGGDPERLAMAASELVRLPVDVIATFGTPATQAAMMATTTIPIVMIGIGDPVRAGLVPSLARPGGNVTGNTTLSADIAAKRLQLLREVFPSVMRVVFFWNPDNASQGPVFEEVRAVAPTLGMTLIPVGVRNMAEFDPAFATMTRERPDAMSMGADSFHLLHLDRILAYLAVSRTAGAVPEPGTGGRGRSHVLRREPARPLPPRRRLRAQDSARHKTRGPPGRGAREIRAGRQPQGRESDGAHNFGGVPAAHG
jgi:putative ABC transport system substrate-binding protein